MELLVASVTLAGLYVISNPNKKKYENFELPNTNITDKNYNEEKVSTDPNSSSLIVNHKFTPSLDTTSKYFDPTANYKSFSSSSPNEPQYLSLTGEYVNASYFTNHSNNQPFYSGKTKTASGGHESYEGLMDAKMGAGSQYITKNCMAPLFKPASNNTWIHGTPNQSDFIESRMKDALSGIQQGVPLMQPKQVAPGLNQGFTDNVDGLGYNSGMASRELWQDKTVDELRMGNKKASEYGILGYEGAAQSAVKNMGSIGKVEKHLPDRMYEVTPDMWFTTTGIEKAPTSRPTQIVKDTQRQSINSEYIGGTQYGGPMQPSEVGTFRPSNHIDLRPHSLGVATATNQNGAQESDFGNGTFQQYINNRTANDAPMYIGGFGGVISGLLSPILDVLRPTRKENMIGNMRPYGAAESHVAQSYIYDPNDTPKPTMKEMHENGTGNLFIDKGQMNDAYGITPYQACPDRTNQVDYFSNAVSGPKAQMSYASNYNQTCNGLREKTATCGQMMQGSMNVGYGSYGEQVRETVKDFNVNNKRALAATINQYTTPSLDKCGMNTQAKMEYIPYERNNADLLEGLKENPYAMPMDKRLRAY